MHLLDPSLVSMAANGVSIGPWPYPSIVGQFLCIYFVCWSLFRYLIAYRLFSDTTVDKAYLGSLSPLPKYVSALARIKRLQHFQQLVVPKRISYHYSYGSSAFDKAHELSA